MKRMLLILLCCGVLGTLSGCYVAPYPYTYPYAYSYMRIRIPIRMYIRIDIHTMVDMEARMVHFGSDRGGEDIITVTIITATDITTEDIRDGIVEGMGDGVGKRALALTSATRRRRFRP